MTVYREIIQHLNMMLNPQILSGVQDFQGNKQIEFKETQNPKETKLKKIVITGFDDVVAINHDKISICNPSLFAAKHGSKKTCDGIVFCILDDKPYIIVFDMKSSLSNESEHILKTKSGKNFLSYLNCVLQEFENKSISNWTTYYCIFHASEPKRETGIESSVSRDPSNPIYYRVENGEEIPLRKILGKPLL